MKHRINISYQCFTVQKIWITSMIKKCIHTALSDRGVNVPCEINVLITDDNGIRAINLASREIDRATDVLSFPMFQFDEGKLPEEWDEYIDPETELCPLGDIAISFQRAVEQAKNFGHSIQREVGYLTIHSVLHLLGYDHLDEGAMKARMREHEERIAAKIRGVQRD